ncbi:MBL fold metallo-hydrolase [Paenibacillus sp. 598K]|uniref:MBL fold metallo-hydrolase n=1 Tax=Paenibacillus sp. 598K TaxID=1117987 RepID=UPI000FFE8EBC|nr:MBL fold metallo-hydrolase [Paenibacillus sp. 598K]
MSGRIELDVWGGVREHGRSCYRLEVAETSVLLDCGGKKERGGLYPRLVPEQVKRLSVVFLSHAHEDHMAALPLLLQHGYTGEIWLTRETFRQLPGYARAWRSYVESYGGSVPYAESDWERLRWRLLDEEAEPSRWMTAAPGVRVCWGPSGHLPGAVWLLLELEGRVAFFSGDYSGESTLLRATMPGPELLEGRRIELAIVDAAYGDAEAEQGAQLDALCDKLMEVHAREGHVLLPVPSCGRGMDLAVELSERLPHMPLAVESTLALEWARLLRSDLAARWLRADAPARLAAAIGRLVTVSGEAQRQQLLRGSPRIILSPDGMMLSEPARAYGRALQQDARHAIVFTGHLSRDARAMGGGVDCEIVSTRYKVHQGLPDVLQMLRALQPLATVLVHADDQATTLLARRLRSLGSWELLDPLLADEEPLPSDARQD